MLISQSTSGILKAPVSSESVENSLNDRKTRLEEKEELSNNNLLLISAVRLKYSTEDAEKLCDHQYVKVKPTRTSSKLENHICLNFPTKLQTNVNSDDTTCVSDFPQQDKNNETGGMTSTGLQTLFGSGKGPPIPEDIPSGSLETSAHSDSANSSKTFSLSIKETLNEIKGSLGLVLRAKNKGLIKANKINNHRFNSLTDSVLNKKNESYLQKPELCCKTGKVSGKNELDFNKSSAYIKENIPECSKSNTDSKTVVDSHHELANEDNGSETKTSFHLDQGDVKDLELPSGFQEEERISTVTSPLSLDDSSIQGREVPTSNGDEETESEEGVKLWLDETSSDTNEFGKQDILSINDYNVPSTSKNPIFPVKEMKPEMSPHEDFNNDAPPPLIPLVEPCILDAPVSPEMPVLTPVLDTREIPNRECFSELQVKKELFPLEVENTDEIALPPTTLVQQSCRYPKVPQVLLEPLSLQLLEKHRSYVSLSHSTDVCCDSKTSFEPFQKTKITVEKNCHPSKDNQRQTRLRGSRQHKTQNKKVAKEKERKDLPQNGVLTRKKFRELSLKSANENNRTKYLENAAQNEKNADVDMIVIDGIEFFSFETEEALKEYTRQDLNKKPTLSVNDDSDSSWPKDLAEIDAKDLNCERPIIPTKTNDITKIKGWRNKVFASETTPVNPSPIYGTKKINWAKRIQLRRQLARVDRKKTDLLTLMKRRRLRIRTRRLNKKVWSRNKKSFAKLARSINEKPKLNNSNYKVTSKTEVTNEDSKSKETARTGEVEKNKAVEENQKETTVYDSPDKNTDKELASDSSDVPKYKFINEKREVQIKTSLNDLAASNPKPIPNFMKAFKTKYGWFQKIGNALIPVGEVSDDIPRYVPALSKPISRPSSLELVTLKSEDAEFAASALYCPEDENKKNDSGVQLTSISLEMAQMAVTAVMNYPIPTSKWEKKHGKRPVKAKEESLFENEVRNSGKTRTSTPSPDKQLYNNDEVEPNLTENASKCGKSFCSFGCVCDSLKTRRRGRRHCGKVDCMFSCVCNRTASDIRIESRSENVEAKNIIMTDEGPVKRRRATRLPARLLDSAFIWTKGKELLIDPDLDVSYRNKRVRLENKYLKSKSSESPVGDKSRPYFNKRHVSTRHSQKETVRLKSPKMKFQNEKCKTPKVPPLKITNLLAKSGFPASVQEWTVVSNSTGTIRENDSNSQLHGKDLSPKSVKSEKQPHISPKQTSLLNLGKYSDTKQTSAQLLNDKQDKIKIMGNSFKFSNEQLISTEIDNLTILRKTHDFDKQHKTESGTIEHTTGYLVPKTLIKNSTLKSILSSPESIPVRVLKSQFTSHKSHNEFGTPIIGIYSIRGVSSHAFIGPIPYKIVSKSNIQTLDGQRLLKKPTEILSSYPYKYQSATNFEDRTSSLSFQRTAQTATDVLTTTSDSKVNWKRYCSDDDDDDIILCLDDIIKKIENEVKSICNKSEQLTNNVEDGFTQVFIQGNKILQKMPNGNVTKFSTSNKRKHIDSNTTKPSEHATKKPSLDASICKPLSVVLTKCDPDKTVVLSKGFSTKNKSSVDKYSRTKERNSPRLLSAEVAPLAWNKNHEPSIPKNKKERQRRHEIFQCFVRLCAVLDPTAVSSWKKNYEKIPSKVIILKKAKQCIRELELYSCNIRKFKKALIKRRNSLFNHYSQLLKVLPTDVQKKTILKLTRSLQQCCVVRKNRSQTQTTWEPDMDYFLSSQWKSRVPAAREVIDVSSDDNGIDDDDDDDDDPSPLESDENSSGGHLSNAQDRANVNYMEMETWQSDENEVGSPTNCVVAVPSGRASELVSSDKPVEMDCEPYSLMSEAIGNQPAKVVIVKDSSQRMYKSRLKTFSPINSQLAKRLHHSNVTTTITGLHYLKNISYADTTQNALVTPYTVFSSEGHNESDESQIVNTYEGQKVHQHLQDMISPDNSEVYFDNSEPLYINSYSSNSETAESGSIDLLSNAIPPEDISERPNVIIVGKPQMIPAPTMDGNAQDLIISDPSYIVANYNDLGALTALQNKTVDSSVPGMEISSKMASDINSYGGSVAEYVVMEGSVVQNSNVMPVDVFPVEPRFGKETLETSKSKEVISEHFEDIILPNDDSVSDEISIELPKIIACSSITEAEFLAEEC